MRRHQTSGAELLRAARGLLKAELLPLLPEDRKLEALMVLSALGMAERELAAEAPAGEAGPIAALLGITEGEEQNLRRQLAQAIRAGRFDGDPALYDLAKAGLEWRLLETDPRVVSRSAAEHGKGEA